jgi:hypothetical protein
MIDIITVRKPGIPFLVASTPNVKPTGINPTIIGTACLNPSTIPDRKACLVGVFARIF